MADRIVASPKRVKKWEIHNHLESLQAGRKRYAEDKRRQLLREAGYESLPDGHKQCLKCRKVKEFSHFHPRKIDKRHPAGSPYRSWCKECESVEQRIKKQSAYGKRWHKNYRLLQRFGITVDDYEKLLLSQNNSCAICGKTKDDDVKKFDLSVDHCHKTGKVRGLLCRHCNVALGKFGDDVAMLQRAIDYLKMSLGDDHAGT